MKYKVGDKVKIREDLNEGIKCYSSVGRSILEYKGKTAEIIGVNDKAYDLDIDNGIYNWNDEMFENYAELNKDTLTDSCIVTLRNGEELVYIREEFYDLSYNYENCVLDICDFEDDLTNKKCKEWDIVSIKIPREYDVINRKEEAKEMTIEEISEALGYEIKIVKEGK